MTRQDKGLIIVATIWVAAVIAIAIGFLVTKHTEARVLASCDYTNTTIPADFLKRCGGTRGQYTVEVLNATGMWITLGAVTLLAAVAAVIVVTVTGSRPERAV